jgi:hypothetical protein
MCKGEYRRYLVDRDSPNSDADIFSYSSTHERKSKTAIIVKHDRIYLKHNSVAEDVPIVVAMKVCPNHRIVRIRTATILILLQ